MACWYLWACILFFSFDFKYKLGLLVAIFSGFTVALFAVLNAQMVKKLDARAISFYEMCSGCMYAGLGLLFLSCWEIGGQPKLSLPTPSDWIYIALLAGACSVYAYTVAIELTKRVPVFVVQLTLNLEPLYGIAMAVLLFGEKEKMPPNFYIGGLLVLCAVFLYPVAGRFLQKIGK